MKKDALARHMAEKTAFLVVGTLLRKLVVPDLRQWGKNSQNANFKKNWNITLISYAKWRAERQTRLKARWLDAVGRWRRWPLKMQPGPAEKGKWCTAVFLALPSWADGSSHTLRALRGPYTGNQGPWVSLKIESFVWEPRAPRPRLGSCHTPKGVRAQDGTSGSIALAALLLVLWRPDKETRKTASEPDRYSWRTSCSQARWSPRHCDQSKCLETAPQSQAVDSSSNPVPYGLAGPLPNCLFL